MKKKSLFALAEDLQNKLCKKKCKSKDAIEETILLYGFTSALSAILEKHEELIMCSPSLKETFEHNIRSVANKSGIKI